MFEKVDPRQSFPKMEEKMLEFWLKEKIFEESVEQRKDKEKYVFFDGPPFANGLPHYGHMLANVIKDSITRYWTMKGYYVPRVNGWDCHGLPVEYEIEKELELSGRKDVVDYGVENFNEKCRESVFRYTNEWEGTLKRLGRLLDFENGYATLDNNYMESIWWVFKQIWDKGLVYTGHKAMHICPRCETPLSNFEVTQGYKDVTDQSLVAKFKSVDEENTYFLAWTTTPWCLPGQIGLTVHPNKTYVKVATEDTNYWLIEKRVDDILRDIPYKVIERKKGKELEGMSYEPLFPYNAHKKDECKAAFTILLDEYVTEDDGSGFVTTSPDFGEDDMRTCMKYGIPFTETVDMAGVYRDHVTDYAGQPVLEANRKVLEDLREVGKLLWDEPYRHSYPHCWRCDTPLLNYATKSFFIEVTKVKDKLLKRNKEIHWQPEHIEEGRFGKWLEGARDWAISRNRFWGCAIPVWNCEKCDEQICIGSIEELKEKSGGKVPERDGELDLHKPYIDEIELKCKCGGKMKRVPDVLDCWFESGSMPYAQLHYPFENKEEFEKNFPAHFIAEGLDQTRGWFYTLHVLAVILFDKPAFKNCIVNGIILADDGEKLSKRKKNYTPPEEIFDTKGVDSMRYFLLSSPAALADDVRFSDQAVDEIVKKFTLTLWNTYSFFVTYANIDKWETSKANSPKNKLDKWILSELHTLIKEVTSQMDDYNLPKSLRPMQDFLENLSNWYVRRSRRRFWKSENDEDKGEAYQTLHTVLVEFCKILAPFMPYISDKIYQNLTGEKSVHLADWPKADEKLIDKELNKEIHFVRLIVNLGHSVRGKARVKVRQPLSKVSVALPEGVDEKILKAQKDVILEELNVKELEFIKEAGELADLYVMPDAKKLGPKYGKDVQEIIQKVKAGEFEMMDDGKLKVGEFILEEDEVEIGYKGKEGLDAESDEGVVVALDTYVTDELKKEGYARDIVRYIQELRKEADYQVDDRIYVLVEASSEVESAVTEFADYIKLETLANELQQSGDMEWDKEKEVEIEGVKVKIAVRK